MDTASVTAISAFTGGVRRLGRLGRMRPAPLRRTDELELLDGAPLEPRELRENLRELAMLNRLPGGADASIAAIERLGGSRPRLEIVDVGTGGADMAVAFARHASRRRGGRTGLTWNVTAIDVRPEILDVAARRVRVTPGVSLVLADARTLPYPDGSFDVAHCSLLLHHLDAEAAVRALAEMRRVARLGVVVNDLQRGWVHFAVTSATVLALARNRYTRHDGVVSARRAYTLAERGELLRRAGLAPCWESATLMPRVATAAIPVGVA